jgi:hypothetical protein
MRHIFSACPVASLPRGMTLPPFRTFLVTLSGALQRVAPRFLGTASDTVDLTTIAAAADDHLDATVRAQEQPSGCDLTLV